MQYLLTQVNVSDILQFLQNMKQFFLMVPCVKDNNPLGTQMKSQGNFNISKLITLTNSRRRYMAEILPIWRKTLSNQLINQSINQSILCVQYV